MIDDTNNPALLPNGLLDLLPPLAEGEARLIEAFLKDFAGFGYARVKPPLVEFEESLLGGGPGVALARSTFRLMDPVSRRMMGVRADVTAQIARIAMSRLAKEARPLRLSYAADVLRANGTQLRPERQFCQVGCEMIGGEGLMADVEVALIAVKALAGAGIKDLSIDLTVPTLLNHLFEGLNVDDAAWTRLMDAVEKRDRDALASPDNTKEAAEAAAMIAALMDGEGSAARAGDAFKKLALPEKAARDVTLLCETAEALKAALDVYGLKDVQITIDPLERRGFEYQTGVSFTLFAKGARGELGRGGRYDVDVAGAPAQTASGFTLYMDTILRVAPAFTPAETKIVAETAGWDEVKALQAQGFQVVRRAGV